VRIRFYLDPATGFPHVHNHGVRESEVEEALRRRDEERAGAEDSRVAVGRTAAGRYLRVIYVPDPDLGSAFVITAYELRGKPLLAYRRRRRRRHER
jgi:hypothetical protein